MNSEGPLAPEFDPAGLLEVFNQFKVRYVVIGGVAAALHGSEHLTTDLDIAHERSEENLGRVWEALRSVGARPLSDQDQDLTIGRSGRRVEQFVTRLGEIDVFAEVWRVGGYEQIAPQAEEMQIRPGLVVRVIDLETLIQSKSGTGRDKDALHVRSLLALREELINLRIEGTEA